MADFQLNMYNFEDISFFESFCLTYFFILHIILLLYILLILHIKTCKLNVTLLVYLFNDAEKSQNQNFLFMHF